MVNILVLRYYMDWENKRRDRAQGFVVEVEPREKNGDGIVVLPTFGLDETDREQEGFHYIL